VSTTEVDAERERQELAMANFSSNRTTKPAGPHGERRPLVIVIALIALTAGLAAGTLAVPSESAPGVEARPAQPVDDSALRPALDELVASGAPGAVVLVRDGDRTVRLASGFANVARRTPMRVTDRFRIGSVTKTFVATVVLQLVRDGELRLSDSVEHWLPGLVPNGTSITVRELLNHTSGLAEYSNQELLAKVMRNPRKPWTPAQLIATATAQKPVFAPGTHWSYSNTGYVLAGLIVEKATGNSLATEIRRRILRPLDLRATTFDSSPRIAGHSARGYALIGKPPAKDVSLVTPTWAGAAGAMVSTADDVARFERALLRGRLLPANLLSAMETTVAMGPPGESYGLGLWKTRSMALSPTFRLPCGTAWGHNGDFPGYLTNAFASRDGRRQMIVLVNSDSLPRPAQIALLRLVRTAYCGSA
jgi:D-alanyl-D-alanine carboxypeptidase